MAWLEKLELLDAVVRPSAELVEELLLEAGSLDAVVL